MRPFLQLSVLLTAPSFSFLKGSYATPNPNPSPQSELTYVAFGVGSELPEPLNSDPSATEWVAPLGTASEETTFLFNEVETAVTDEASTTVTVQITETGTLIASASGFTLSVLSTGTQGLVGAEAECHFTAAGSGECVQNLHGEGDLLTLTFSGSVATHALSVSGASATVTASTVTSSVSGSATNSASSFVPSSAPGTQGSSASSGSSTASPTSINPSDSVVTSSPAITSTGTANNGASSFGFDFRAIIMVIMGILTGMWAILV